MAAIRSHSYPRLGDFHARTRPISVSAALGDAITGVFGFNNHRELRRLPRKSRLSEKRLNAAAESRPWFIPTELATIYNFPNANAQNQCIGLLEFGAGVEQSDVAAYFQKIGVSAPNIQIVAVYGVSTDPGAGRQLRQGPRPLAIKSRR